MEWSQPFVKVSGEVSTVVRGLEGKEELGLQHATGSVRGDSGGTECQELQAGQVHIVLGVSASVLHLLGAEVGKATYTDD